MSNTLPGGVPSFPLTGGIDIPQLGFGVWQVPDDEAQAATEEALRIGYRHIDTAAAYQNESGVGRALAAAGLPRDEVFVTTKLWNSEHGYDRTMRAFDQSMAKLGIEQLDLYLIHWPRPDQDLYTEAFKAMLALQEQGRIRAVGVSNFHRPHLEAVIEATGVTPAINQIELHPYLQQAELRAFHEENGIATEAYSPLGSGGGLLDDPILVEIARRNDVTVAQVVLSWHLSLGNVTIPKSVTPSRIAENFASVKVNLPETDLAAIAKLDRGERTGADPDTATF